MNAADRHLSVPGATLRYRDEGAGPAVVLVHGWTLDLDIFEPQAALDGMRVLRFDRRGFGLSSGASSLLADVDDLRALLAELRVVRPLLLGMSQGARVVLEFAARHPGSVRGLVLDGAPPLTGSDLPMLQFRETARRQGLAAFHARWAAHPLTQLVTPDPAPRALLARVLARYPGSDLLAHSGEMRETIDDSLLAQIRVPVQIINGELDLDSRLQAGRELGARLPDANRAIIAGAGHMPNLDAPRAYNQIVNKFARRHLSAVA
jgi:pimeloyl-ACP methyl ester carboxylesterase